VERSFTCCLFACWSGRMLDGDGDGDGRPCVCMHGYDIHAPLVISKHWKASRARARNLDAPGLLKGTTSIRELMRLELGGGPRLLVPFDGTVESINYRSSEALRVGSERNTVHPYVRRVWCSPSPHFGNLVLPPLFLLGEFPT